MIDMNKKYKTRDGRKVRIYAVDGGGDYPVHGAIKEEGVWLFESWASDGQYSFCQGITDSDLIEKKPKPFRNKKMKPYGELTEKQKKRLHDHFEAGGVIEVHRLKWSQARTPKWFNCDPYRTA